jgi:hypothetical protein
MLRRLLLSSALFTAFFALAYGQSGTLQGILTDQETKEPIPFANIVIELNGRQAGGTSTDFDGKYTIKPIPPGTYSVKATTVGYRPMQINGVLISADKIRILNITLEPTAITIKEVTVVDYQVPLIDPDQTSSGGTMTSEEISKMPGRSAQSVATTVGGVFSQDGEMGSIRGQRTEGTVMYIDGVRVRGSSSLPQSAIEQVSVITGGTPAKYGDVTGGVVNVTTKGASQNFGAGVEFLTSQFLDPYGYNLLGFNVQGPILMKKDSIQKSSIVGFFISGELSSARDGDPSAIGVWRAKENVLSSLVETPLRPSGTGFGSFQNGEFIHIDDLENIKAKENAYSRGANLSAKIDVRTSVNSNLTFGANLNYGAGRIWSLGNSLFNSVNNGSYVSNTWRVFGRFTQRFPAAAESKSLIKNVYYSIQADYSQFYQVTEDDSHRDNFFNYGYVGKFTTYKIKSYELGSDTVLGLNDVWIHNGWRDTLYNFERSEINPDLANYTDLYYSLYDLHSGFYSNSVLVENGGGLLNGQGPASVYGMWTNTGSQYNGYAVSNASQIGISANGSADIGNHEVQFGLVYEQRIDRAFSLGPVGLWTLMRRLTNSHIEQRDLTNPQAVYDANGVFQDTINYNRIYDEASQFYFDYNLRQTLGLKVDGTDWIDVDNYDPSLFKLEWFSADELLNSGNSYVNYYGYDHTGKILDYKPSFDDFFTATDAFGNKTRPIGAFEPIYMAGYIQDKFAFRDLIFNIGLRVDRFDANQKVLKDPYLLFNAKTVQEVGTIGNEPVAHPGNMGDDYIVYVNDIKNPTAIVGYRSGAVWFDAEGTEVTNPQILETAQGIAPYLVNPDQTEVNSSSFADYEPQTTFMPRVSFSFPISDDALFFAHYDVLSKRPTSGARLDPTDYYFIYTVANNTLNNPNLKPEKTVDYELGFQQKINAKSSLKFSAYYREMRDMVQVYRFSQAYPISYISYNNIDFGTVKGTTVSYDLRRSNNIWMKASYTLQFASGTGSSATSGTNLVRSGQPNLRVLNPFDFDRRHNVSLVVDYRFADGKHYNGPVIKRTDKATGKTYSMPMLANTGINFTFTGGSGVPYSKSSKIVPLGSDGYVLQGQINGSRLPWQFRMDARVDKDFALVFGAKEGQRGKVAYFNVYLQVLNVLNSKNVLSVYRATGNPDDDGYLAAAEYQTQINQQIDSESYRDLYMLRVNSPYNYSSPRRIRLGIAFNF